MMWEEDVGAIVCNFLVPSDFSWEIKLQGCSASGMPLSKLSVHVYIVSVWIW